jgi:hypothetical protein
LAKWHGGSPGAITANHVDSRLIYGALVAPGYRSPSLELAATWRSVSSAAVIPRGFSQLLRTVLLFGCIIALIRNLPFGSCPIGSRSPRYPPRRACSRSLTGHG